MFKKALLIFTFLFLITLSAPSVFAKDNNEYDYKKFSGVITGICYNHTPNSKDGTISLTIQSKDESLNIFYLGSVDPFPSWVSLGKPICGIGKDFSNSFGFIVATKLSENCDIDSSTDFITVNFKNLTSVNDELKKWVDKNKETPGNYITEINGKKYLLVAHGLVDNNFSLKIKEIVTPENSDDYYVYYTSTVYNGSKNILQGYTPYVLVELLNK